MRPRRARCWAGNRRCRICQRYSGRSGSGGRTIPADSRNKEALRPITPEGFPACEHHRVTALAGASVVLLVVDLMRHVVLLMVDRGAVGGGQMAVIRCAHVVLFVVDTGFLGF